MCVWCVHKCMQIMMHISIILDLDTCVYDVHTCVYDVHIWCAYSVWYTYLWSWSLILVHACMMHVSKVIDPDTCVYHAGMYDEFWSSILGPYAWMYKCMYLWCGWNFFTDERTDGQGDSRSWISRACIQKYLFTDTLMLAWPGRGYVRTADLHLARTGRTMEYRWTEDDDYPNK